MVLQRWAWHGQPSSCVQSWRKCMVTTAGRPNCFRSITCVWVHQDRWIQKVSWQGKIHFIFYIIMPIKQSILHDYDGNTVQERGHIRGTQWQFPPKYIENTFSAIWSTVRSLEMYSKQYYKICIYSVILGELKSFQNYKGFSIILFFWKF